MKNTGKIIALCLVISLVTVGVVAQANTFTQFVSGDFWSFNSGTIVTNDSSWNVCLGVNKTTGYKLEVEGDSLFSRIVINNSGSIDFGLTSSIYKDLVSMNLITSDILKLNGYKKLVLCSDKPLGTGGIWMYTDGGIDISCAVSKYINITGKVCLNDSLVSVGNIETNSAFQGYGVVPVGCILAWVGDSYGLLLPDNFVICNGSQILDVNSTLNGSYTPDLTGLFLRGNETSNGTGGATRHNHAVNIPTSTVMATAFGTGMSGSTQRTPSHSHTVSGITGDADTIPPYYEVVYIMRIK